MSEASKGVVVSTSHGEVGPDYFGYYRSEIEELLSQDKDFVPFTSQTSDLDIRKHGEDGGKVTTENICNGADSLFDNSKGTGLSDFKLERLKSLLRQGVLDLTPEVDEMLDPVIATCELQTQLRNKKCLSSDAGAVEVDATIPCKKIKTCSCTSSTNFDADAGPLKNGSCREVDEDLQFLLENDSLLVEKTVKKYSDELYARLGHMEGQLEELLDIVVSKCRPMTCPEKQELRELIQKLPPNNLLRVAEIVQHKKLAETQSSNELLVDLEQEDNVTLWRFYYYVKAVEKARELI